MSRILNLTSYYKQVQERSNLGDQSFGASTSYRTVDIAEVKSGKLNRKITDELFKLADDKKNKGKKGGAAGSKPSARDKNRDPIDVILSLVTLKREKDIAGLLLLPASLDHEGNLAADLSTAEPWIPARRMRSKGTEDREVMVGDMSDFWKWRTGKGLELESNIENWSDVVDMSFDLFSSVRDAELPNVAADVDAKIIEDVCFVTADQVIKANGGILDLYQHLIDGGLENAPVYQRMLSGSPSSRADSDVIDLDRRWLKESARYSLGSMSDEFGLTESQRRAVHAFLHDCEAGDSSLTAVSGPPGTGKTTMLQSVVATLIVKHALEGKPAPLIVGTSTNNQAVTNIIDSFGKVTKDDPDVLEHRWLPVAAEDGAGDNPLPGLATYCPAGSKFKQAKDAGYLVEDIRKGGVYSVYSDPAYTEGARAYFYAQLADYSGPLLPQAPKTATEAAELLHKVLVMSDRHRTRLIGLRSDLDEQVGAGPEALQQQREEVVSYIQGIQGFRDFWQEKYAELTAGGQNVDPAQESFVLEFNSNYAGPAGPQSSVAAYITAYTNLINSAQSHVQQLDQQIEYTRRQAESASEVFRTKARESLTALKALGRLSDEQVEKIARASNLYELDQALDTTVRYAQFWLAVHLYEAQWLAAAESSGEATGFVPSDERYRTTVEVMDKYWKQAAALTPCFVMTAYQLPKYFRLYSKEAERSVYDLGRPDLLIVDEAGQVDVSVGAAGFALPKRALVVGDVQQLAPVWSIDPESDQVMASGCGLGALWDNLKAEGLTSSDPSSIMAAASTATRWHYGPDKTPGLFLAEHFRCHDDIINYCNDLLYNGLLKPSRPLGKYKLKDAVARPFLFREVSGSEDQKKGSSRVNHKEAEDIADWIGRNFSFFQNIYNPDRDAEKNKELIGVVTPFAAQARLIEQKIRQKFDTEIAQSITVGTAHRLQGAERAVVLFSSVYGDKSGTASFIDTTLELMNVAVSRAKDLFIVVGGQKRWTDTGPVFSLVRQFAVKDPAEFGEQQQPDPVAAEQEHGTQAPPREEKTEVPAPQAPQPPQTVPPKPQRAPQSASVPRPSSNIPLVDRNSPGYDVLSTVLAQLKTDGVLPADSTLKATQANKALIDAGLLVDVEKTKMPTDAGVELGIAMYEGTSSSGSFKSPIYSAEAQKKLADLIRSGQLRFE